MSLVNEGIPFTMPVQPANGNVGGNGNGLFGNGEGSWFIIILFLFAFLGWGNRGGIGGGGNGSMPYIINTSGESGGTVQRGFDHQAVITKLDGITQGICDSTYALSGAINNGFANAELSRCHQQAALMQQLSAMQMQDLNCCCENRAAIAQVRYDMATQACDTRNTIQNTTRDIIDNQNANSRAILDFLTQDKIATLQAENQSLKLAASQSNQNAVLMAAMDANKAEILRRSGHDCPSAAYIVQPPTPVNFPVNGCGTFTGYGCNTGCGC